MPNSADDTEPQGQGCAEFLVAAFLVPGALIPCVPVGVIFGIGQGGSVLLCAAELGAGKRL